MKFDLYSLVFRSISIVLASTLSMVILIMPQLVTYANNKADHSLLMLLMFGIILGFIHGIGFKPETTFYRYLFSPILGWLLMIIGVIIALYN